MSNKSPLLTDKMASGAPVQLRPKGRPGRRVSFTYAGNGKDRTKAYGVQPHQAAQEKEVTAIVMLMHQLLSK